MTNLQDEIQVRNSYTEAWTLTVAECFVIKELNALDRHIIRRDMVKQIIRCHVTGEQRQEECLRKIKSLGFIREG